MKGLTNPFEAARYHSLVIDREGFPDDALEVTAWTEDGTIMGVRHRQYPHIQVWAARLQLLKRYGTSPACFLF